VQGIVFAAEELWKPRDLLNQGQSRAARVCRRESQPLTLLGPAQGKVLTQFVKVQVEGLATGKDRLNDIGRKESAAEDLTNVTVCQVGIASQRSVPSRFRAWGRS
jgi:hypothetical protein